MIIVEFRQTMLTDARMLDGRFIDSLRIAAESYSYLSIKEASERYGVSIRTLRRMQAEGMMPPRHKRGRLLEYPIDALDIIFNVKTS
jgi:hypothetical protein